MPDETTCGPHPEAPWFSAFYDVIMQPLERRLLANLRASLLVGQSGRILEIGAGTGANLPMLAPEIRQGSASLTALEPDPHMRWRAERKASEQGVPVQFVSGSAELLPFADHTFDRVVGTLVLCSVADPTQSLREIRRVLRPDGEFRFIEHVRAPGTVGRLQDILRPGWACLGAGCQLNRRTEDAIRQAGFEVLHLEEKRAPFPIARVIWGAARP